MTLVGDAAETASRRQPSEKEIGAPSMRQPPFVRIKVRDGVCRIGNRILFSAFPEQQAQQAGAYRVAKSRPHSRAFSFLFFFFCAPFDLNQRCSLCKKSNRDNSMRLIGIRAACDAVQFYKRGFRVTVTAFRGCTRGHAAGHGGSAQCFVLFEPAPPQFFGTEAAAGGDIPRVKLWKSFSRLPSRLHVAGRQSLLS